jgi:hypothetical protein
MEKQYLSCYPVATCELKSLLDGNSSPYGCLIEPGLLQRLTFCFLTTLLRYTYRVTSNSNSCKELSKPAMASTTVSEGKYGLECIIFQLR